MCVQRVRRAIRERGQVGAGPSEGLVDACVSRLTSVLSVEGGAPCERREVRPCCKAWDCWKPLELRSARQSCALETLRPLLHRPDFTHADAADVLDFAERVTQTILWVFEDDFVGDSWTLQGVMLGKHSSQRRRRLLSAEATDSPASPLARRAVKLTPFDVWLRLEDLDDRRAAALYDRRAADDRW